MEQRQTNIFMTLVLGLITAGAVYFISLYILYPRYEVWHFHYESKRLQAKPRAELWEDLKAYEMSQDIRALVIDMNRNGINWSGSTVMWDINTDGFRNEVHWIDNSDAFLVTDKNGNGKVDDHSEILGGANISGFEMLREYDNNHDDIIDKYDARFHDLLLWYEPTGRWMENTHSLVPLEVMGITSLHLKPQKELYNWEADNKGLSPLEISQKKQTQNIIAIKGKALNHKGQKHTLADVKLHYSKLNTSYAGEVTKDPSIMALPDLRGYGALPDLRIAMHLDDEKDDKNSLVSYVTILQETPFEQLFLEEGRAFSLTEKILYRWANVDKLDKDARGPNIDARNLVFVETFLNEPFRQLGLLINPRPDAAHGVNNTYLKLWYSHTASLLVQGFAKQLFNGPVRGDVRRTLTFLQNHYTHNPIPHKLVATDQA